MEIKVAVVTSVPHVMNSQYHYLIQFNAQIQLNCMKKHHLGEYNTTDNKTMIDKDTKRNFRSLQL